MLKREPKRDALSRLGIKKKSRFGISHFHHQVSEIVSQIYCTNRPDVLFREMRILCIQFATPKQRIKFSFLEE